MMNLKRTHLEWTLHAGCWLALALTSACDDDAAAQPDAATEPDAAVPAPGPGELHLVIDGLPAGVAAYVEIIGPDGFRSTVTSTSTLGGLAPGDYSIVPFPVAGPDPDLGYDVLTDVSTVVIGADAGATARVLYEPLATELAAEAVLADDALAQSLESLLREEDMVTLRFSSVTPQLATLVPGDLLALPSTPAAPDGFLGRVMDVEGAVVTARDAPIEELIVQGVFVLGQPVTAANVREVVSIEDGRSVALATELVPASSLVAHGQMEKSVSFDAVCVNATREIAAGIGLGAAIAVDSSVCFSGSATVAISVKPLAKPRLRANFGFNGAVSSTLRGTGLATLGLDVSVPIYKVVLGAQPVGPLIMTPILIVYVNPSGQIATGVTTAVSQNFNFGASLALSGGGAPSQAVPAVSGSYSASVEYPRPVANASLKLAAGPAVAYSVYGMAGPELGVDGYVRFDVDLLAPPPTPQWTVHGGVDFRAGVSLFSGLLRFSDRIQILERLLLKSTDVPPAGSPGFSLVTGRSYYEHVAIAADDTIVVAEVGGRLGAYTSFGAERWRVDVGTPGFPAAPSIAADGTIYVLGSNKTLSAISAAGAPLWSQTFDGFGSGSGLAIAADGTIYVSLYDRLEARSPTNGTLIWSLPAPSDVDFTGSPAVGPGGDIYVGGFHGRLTAARPDGSVRWSVPVADFRVHEPALSADGATIYVTTDTPNDLVAVNASTGNVIWRRTFAISELAMPPVVGPDGTIYVASIDDRLVAYAPDGTPRWAHTLVAPALGENPSGAAAVADNGTVVIATTDGYLHMISQAGTPLFKGSTLGHPSGAVVIDRRGAALVLGSCLPSSSSCGISAVFTGGWGPAPSWSKVQGALDNSGRR